jgi:tetratricopeptide (TPR) repeat protein
MNWAVWAAAAVILVAVLAAYSNSFHGPFVFDDIDTIHDNRSIRRLWPPWQALSPKAFATAEGRPVLNLSLAICYAIGEFQVEPYHVFNLAIHLLAGLALFGVVRRIAMLPSMQQRFGRAAAYLAAAVATLWTLHPLQTESVTYVIQRAESMMGLFYLLTIYCVLRGLDAARPQPWNALAIVACALGMATKEVMVSAPMMVVLFDRIFFFGSFREAWRRRRGMYVGLAATWAILFALILISGGRSGSVALSHGQVTPLQYAMTQCRCIIRYLWLSFWPAPLVFDYGAPDAGVPIIRSLTECAPWLAGLLAVIAAAVLAVRRWPKWGFLGLWFFAILAPSSSFVPIVTEVVAEHRMYLPLAAIAAGVVFLAYQCGRAALRRFMASDRLRMSVGISISAVALLTAGAILGWRTHLRNCDYRTGIALWSDTARKWPDNPRAHNDLGVALADAGENEAALVEYNKTLTITPDKPNTLNNRGLVYHHTGRLEEAIRDFTRAIELDPDYVEAYVNRGAVYGSQDRFDLAMEDLNIALRLQPDHADGLFNRGAALFYMGQYDAALADFNRSIELYSKRADCYRNRAVIHYLNRNYDKAWADVRMCRKLGGALPEDFHAALVEESGRKE